MIIRSIILMLLFASLIFSQTHPRLFFSPSDVTTLQSRATTSGTPAYEIWQMLKEMQADHFSVNKNSIITNPYQMPNLLAVALAFIITENNSYLNATRDIIFGGTGVPEGLVYRVPYSQDGDGTSGWSEEFYRTKQVLTLSMVADILWNSLTQQERLQIGYKCALEINNEIRNLVIQPWFHINNNHLARIAEPMAYAAITFHDLFDAGTYHFVYPNAINDLNRVRSLIVTNLNGKKNIVERLYDTEGSCIEGFEYSLIGLSHTLPLIEALTRFDGVNY